ncbi:MAG TPA: tetratricopeptide repeat protein [bacterium]|nr:tetratricopeptide repeat protein [bacterium]
MTRRFFLIIFLILFIAGCGYKKDPKNNAVSAEDASRIKRLEMQLNSSADKGLIYIELGDIYRKNKQDDSALEHYKKSIDFLSHKIPGYSKILSLYYEKKEYDKLEEFVLNLSINKKNPDYLNLFLKLSDVYLNKRELKKYIGLLEELKKNFPENSGLTERLISAYLEAGEYYLAENMITALMKKNNKDAAALYFSAKYANLLKKTEESKNLYKKIIELNVENGKYQALAHKELGLINLNEHQYSEALNYFDKSSKYFTEDSELFYLKGLCYFNLFNYIMALENLNKSIEFDAANHNAHFLLAKVLIKHLKLYKEAVYNLDELLTLFPENLEYLKMKADCLFVVENFSEAVETYKRIVELDPVGIYAEESFLALGTINKKIDNKPSALKEYLAGAKYFPSNWQFYFNAANIFDDMGELEQSAGMYLKAIQLNPETNIIYINLGNVYFKQKFYSKAASCYEYALKLGKNPDAAYNLAIVEKILNKSNKTEY